MVERRKTSQIAYTRDIHGHQIPFYRMTLDTGEQVLVPHPNPRRPAGYDRRMDIVDSTPFADDATTYHDTPFLGRIVQLALSTILPR